MSAVIRPCVLEWAQRRGGRDDDDMRGKFANWDRWLTEEERPGFSEVEAIANFTHVPVGYLFLSEPPQEELPIPDFRAGRGPDIAPSGDLLETIYLNQRRQGWYEDYLTEFGDADPLPFVGSARHASVERAADMIRKELNYGIEVRLRMRSIAGAMRWPPRSPCRSPICAPNSTPASASPRSSNVWPTDTGAPLSSF